VDESSYTPWRRFVDESSYTPIFKGILTALELPEVAGGPVDWDAAASDDHRCDEYRPGPDLCPVDCDFYRFAWAEDGGKQRLAPVADDDVIVSQEAVDALDGVLEGGPGLDAAAERCNPGPAGYQQGCHEHSQSLSILCMKALENASDYEYDPFRRHRVTP